MFEDFRRAWRQAVTNFWRELEADVGPDGEGVYREVARARNQLDRLNGEIGDARQRLAEETEQAEICVRRERLARDIGDAETADLAAEYGARHRERAAVLERKVEALEAERSLCRRDLGEMERALQDGRGPARESMDELSDLNRHPAEPEFRDLEEASRDRSARERLEELKRRMGQ